MDANKFDFVLFDLIGTTVRDSPNGESLILDAFYNAFYINGFKIDRYLINQQRGKSKKEAIKILLTDYVIDQKLSEKIYSDFIGVLNDSLGSFNEIDGTFNVFNKLKEKNIMIGLGSGLPKDFMLAIIARTGWPFSSFDYLGSSEELGSGRPNPIMINDAMKKLNLDQKERVLKVGDTIVDIQEGQNAGVKTACVLTGTQSREMLKLQTPDYIFTDITDLLNII